MLDRKSLTKMRRDLPVSFEILAISLFLPKIIQEFESKEYNKAKAPKVLRVLWAFREFHALAFILHWPKVPLKPDHIPSAPIQIVLSVRPYALAIATGELRKQSSLILLFEQ
jgi:hypothetical protein